MDDEKYEYEDEIKVIVDDIFEKFKSKNLLEANIYANALFNAFMRIAVIGLVPKDIILQSISDSYDHYVSEYENFL